MRRDVENEGCDCDCEGEGEGRCVDDGADRCACTIAGGGCVTIVARAESS